MYSNDIWQHTTNSVIQKRVKLTQIVFNSKQHQYIKTPFVATKNQDN